MILFSQQVRSAPYAEDLQNACIRKFKCEDGCVLMGRHGPVAEKSQKISKKRVYFKVQAMSNGKCYIFTVFTLLAIFKLRLNEYELIRMTLLECTTHLCQNVVTSN